MPNTPEGPVDRREFLKGAAVSAASLVRQVGPVPQSPGHDDQAVPSDMALRVKALESLLVEKGMVDRAALDAVVDTYETKIGPRNGARVVARAWIDPAYKKRLLTSGTPAIAELGYSGAQGEHMVVLENTSKVHNLVVCTLCSCYPWPVLGLPPIWYKSAPYRSRAVIDPRGVLREFGLDLPDDVEVRVWDSTADLRYLVLPERPAGTESMSEDALAALVTRDSMVGVAEGDAVGSRRARMNSVHDMGGMHGMGPIEYNKNEPVFHEPWEGRAWALVRTMGRWGRPRTRNFRYELELIPAADYLRMSYYERFMSLMIDRLLRANLVTRTELENGRPDPGSVNPTASLPQAPRGGLPRVEVPVKPRFKVGQHVRARNIHPLGHTRLPRYARGRRGRITRDHGPFAFQDTDVNGDPLTQTAQHVYTVQFSARELWGQQARSRDSVCVDLWDDHLERA